MTKATTPDPTPTSASSSEMEPTQLIWLEISNVKIENQDLAVQFKGDKADFHPTWRPVNVPLATGNRTPWDLYRDILEGLDKGRIVLARLECGRVSSTSLQVTAIRIQRSESNSL